MHPRYTEWLTHVFDHAVADHNPEWYFGEDAPEFLGSDEAFAVLITETFQRSGVDLTRFSDGQVNQGLWYLVSPAGSDFMFSLRDGEAPLIQKIEGIRSIYDLYRDCFAARCPQTLGHIDESGASDLNLICYMFWDICPLSCLEGYRDATALSDAVFWVLGKTLEIDHRACREGALHGLGEVACFYPERVMRLVDQFLDSIQLDSALRSYALSAREGDVQ